MTLMLTGQCDCGAVRVTIPGPPRRINACPCRYCQQIGGRWGYFRPESVEVTGPTTPYQRAERVITFHHCAICGVTTHWSPARADIERIGVQMANFDQSALVDVPVVCGV